MQSYRKFLFVSAVTAGLLATGQTSTLDVASPVALPPHYRRGGGREPDVSSPFAMTEEDSNMMPFRAQESVFGDAFTSGVGNPLDLLTAGSDLLSRGASAFTEGVAALVNAGSVPLTAMGRVFMEPVASAASLIYKPFTDLLSVTTGGNIPQSAPPRRLFLAPSSDSYADSPAARHLRVSSRLPLFENAIDPLALLLTPPAMPEVMLRPPSVNDAEATDERLLLLGHSRPAVPRSLRGGGDSGTFNYSNYPYYAGHPYYSKKTGYFETPYPEPFMVRAGETPKPFAFDFGPQGPRVRVDNGVLVPI